MLETVGKYALILSGALGLTSLARWIKSDYLSNFFADNAILLSITVFTIHAAAVGILMSQLEILKQRVGNNFSSTIQGIRNSFKEALVWIALVMVGAIIQRSLGNAISPLYGLPYVQEICSFIIVVAVIALLAIVLDTVNAILICLEQPSR